MGGFDKKQMPYKLKMQGKTGKMAKGSVNDIRILPLLTSSFYFKLCTYFLVKKRTCFNKNYYTHHIMINCLRIETQLWAQWTRFGCIIGIFFCTQNGVPSSGGLKQKKNLYSFNLVCTLTLWTDNNVPVKDHYTWKGF